MNAAPYFGVIDIGNSGIKASLAETANQRLIGNVRSIHWRLPNDQHKSPPAEFQTREFSWASIDDSNAIRQMLDDLTSRVPSDEQLSFWRVSSVQPHGMATLMETLAQRSSQNSYQVICFRDIPMDCQVDNPESVGSDRLLAAWGAWQASAKKNPLIVVQAGTAVTMDWVNEHGTFCGGAIMPGISLTLKYLALGTAHLPWLAPPQDPSDLPLPGKNTRDAMLAGVMASVSGGIEQLQGRYRQQFSGNPNTIETVVSGGDGLSLAQSITPPYKIIDHLVLRALAMLNYLKT